MTHMPDITNCEVERRFVIHETDVDRINGHDSISESALKRNLETIIKFFTKNGTFRFTDLTWDATLKVLLNGREEK